MSNTWRLSCFCCFILALAWLPHAAQAGIEWKTLREVKLANRVIDVTVSSEGNLVFALTPGKIIVYSMGEDTVVDQIEIDTVYTRLTYSKDERLILSAPDPSVLKILKYDRVYDINITNRPFKGPRDAAVTLIVFDDYQ